MFRSVTRQTVPVILLLAAASTCLFGGCNSVDVVIAELDASPPPSFALSEAGPDVIEAGLTEYCPSNECPAPWTTCPMSRFPCDVNLLTDEKNCGECGHVCPGSAPGGGTFQCVEGKCVMRCGQAPENLDCDGVPDNGCETKSTTNDDCGACGVKCTDPAKPCVGWLGGYRCGCPDGALLCPGPDGRPTCIDPSTDDANCGSCGHTCDPAGDGSPLPPNTYYGCREGKCGRRKCDRSFPSFYMDCDGDIDLPVSNGCEASSFSKETCGACGNACAPDQECQGNEAGMPFCACAPGETYCGDICLDIGGYPFCITGKCTDIASDRENCGACKHVCPQSQAPTPLSAATCSFGTCGTQCVQGRADCNGNPADECEVDTNSDPRNCGGCGIICDAIAGQACVGGRCVVSPCEQPRDDGGVK